MPIATRGTAKYVTTKDLQGAENGFLLELAKDGCLTWGYLTATRPGAFKGYHLHRVRAANYVVIRGKMLVTLYAWDGHTWVKEEHQLDASEHPTLHIPQEVATGLKNIGDEECWLVNFPDPPYNPELKDEQVEYTLQELEAGVRK